jgi:ribonucleotide reductase beta subunit family protein with ferritin-like domain
MKKILLFVVIIILVSGCRYFEEKRLFSKKVDTLINYAAEMDKSLEVDTVPIQAETAAVSLQTEPPDIQEEDIYKSTYSGVANRYYVITGCFMMPEFAERYAEKMRSMGYTTEIILRDDGFHMVSVGSFGNLRASLDNLGSVRADITPKAWVYKKR